MSIRSETDGGGAPFGRYAEWYDAFNRGKDYLAEARYVLESAGTRAAAPARWLDVGCGTGGHVAALRSLGVAAEGLDRSAAMIVCARAAHPHVPFHLGELQSLPEPRAFAVISMLFHVFNYQTSEADAAALLGAAAARLESGGVLLFDFWNTAAVLRHPPATRIREASIAGRRLFRVAHPVEDRARSLVDVRYEFRWDSLGAAVDHRETHRMRHFSVAALERLLAATGFDVLTVECWMERRPLVDDDWYGMVCARKRGGS